MRHSAIRTALLVALGAAACGEPLSTKVAVAPEVVREARLVVSDSAAAVGARVDVFADVMMPAAEVAGSFTARIRYDTTALRYEDELAIADATVRATNATAGLVRFAGAAQNGVVQGRLAGFRFTVLKASGVQSLQLTMDELHTVARVNAASALRVVR